MDEAKATMINNIGREQLLELNYSDLCPYYVSVGIFLH